MAEPCFSMNFDKNNGNHIRRQIFCQCQRLNGKLNANFMLLQAKYKQLENPLQKNMLS